MKEEFLTSMNDIITMKYLKCRHHAAHEGRGDMGPKGLCRVRRSEDVYGDAFGVENKTQMITMRSRDLKMVPQNGKRGRGLR